MEGLRAHLHRAFSPLDLFGIHGFPHECYKRVLRTVLEFFGSDEDSTIHPIVSFSKLMADLKVYHEDDLMIVFALTFEGDAEDLFNDLWDQSIDSMAKFFEKFLLRQHEGIVDDIEQLAKEYDALLPMTQLDAEEEIHEEHFEDQSKQFKEHIIEDLIEEALQGPLVEELPDIDIEDEKLPQVYFEINNTCIADLPHERLLNDKSQIAEGLPIAYLSPLQCYIDEACALMCYMVKNFEK